MKKDDDPTSGDQFPVDTLGIPILVDVVETGQSQAPWGEPLERERQISGPDPDTDESDQQTTTPDPLQRQALSPEEIIEKISTVVASNVVQALEPMIQKKITRALKKHKNDLAGLLAGSAPEDDKRGE